MSSSPPIKLLPIRRYDAYFPSETKPDIKPKTIKKKKDSSTTMETTMETKDRDIHFIHPVFLVHHRLPISQPILIVQPRPAIYNQLVRIAPHLVKY